MTRRHSATFLLLIVTSLLFAACGKSTSSTSPPSSTHTALSRAQLVTAAEAICRTANAKRDLIKKDELPAYVVGRLAAQKSETAELEKLVPPSSMASDWSKIVAGSRDFTSDLTKLERYATSSNAKLPASLISAGSSAQEQILTTAKRDGLSQCSRIELTSADR